LFDFDGDLYDKMMEVSFIEKLRDERRFPDVQALVEQIRLREIDIVVIDPFVSCHGVPENDNTAQDMVVKEWGRVAEEGNCAVHLVDHTRKAGADAEVTTESSRGAKAKTDAARVVRVVNRMTDAQSVGIVAPWRYFSAFNDKANMAPPVIARIGSI
jgi:RecA-family ATPase